MPHKKEKNQLSIFKRTKIIYTSYHLLRQISDDFKASSIRKKCKCVSMECRTFQRPIVNNRFHLGKFKASVYVKEHTEKTTHK